MKRRSFILSGIGICAIGVSSASLFNRWFSSKNLYTKPALLSQLCDDETIRLLGRAYLQMNPDERHRDRIMKELYGHSINIDTVRQQGRLLMRAQSENFIRRDFAAGDTVILEGWVLSVTEARQCALFLMINA